MCDQNTRGKEHAIELISRFVIWLSHFAQMQGPGNTIVSTLAQRQYYHKSLWLTIAPAQADFVDIVGVEAGENVLTAGQVGIVTLTLHWHHRCGLSCFAHSVLRLSCAATFQRCDPLSLWHSLAHWRCPSSTVTSTAVTSLTLTLHHIAYTALRSFSLVTSIVVTSL